MSSRRWFRRRDTVPVPELMRSNPLRFGIVVILALVVVVYFGFTKRVPFKHGYQLKGVFASAQNIHAKSPVRIAGVRTKQRRLVACDLAVDGVDEDDRMLLARIDAALGDVEGRQLRRRDPQPHGQRPGADLPCRRGAG